jgi:cellobiose-specific phosphotransferase system component IIC
VKKILVLFAAVTVGCASTQDIGKDKYYHFAAGATTAAVANEMELPRVASSFAAGFAKESYDYIRNGHFDTKDLVATTLGGIVVNYVIKLIKKKRHVEINKEIPEGRMGPIME